MDQFQSKFLEEAADLIEDLEKILLAVECNGISTDSVEHIFRVMHTVKGSSAMFGYDSISEFTHHLETIYDLVRNGKMAISKEILDVTLASIDHIRCLLEDNALTNSTNKERHATLTQQIKGLIGTEEVANNNIPPLESKRGTHTYYVLFKPHKQMLLKGNNPLYLLSDLQAIGNCKVIWRFQNVPAWNDLQPQECHVYWEILIACKETITELRDVFIFVEDECDLTVETVASEDLFLQPTFVQWLEQLPLRQAAIDIQQAKAIALGQKEQASNGPKSEAKNTVASRNPPKDANGSSIRVASDKLDDLLNLVSELVTTQARLSLYADTKNTEGELHAIAENIEKISRRLRDNTFSICLIPIESMLTRFQRLIRDLSKQLNKDIAFVTEGTETEIDKTIADNLTDPLMHIFRNCIDHGIEEAAMRTQKGKPTQGTIALRAYYSGTNVHIEIQDDGGGIDPVRIREKAISKGLIHTDVALTEKEIFDLMFLPGFSTASQVTEVSGRGVGMDVVKRQIAALRGAVEVESKVNEGTMIRIILPLTLSIMDGLLVKIDDTKYVIPLMVVEKCYEVTALEVSGRFDNLLELEGQLIPFFNLREEFDLLSKPPAIQQLIVVKSHNKKIGITVDAILGEYQAVLKPLGSLYKSVEIMSGATILGDGTIALVMDTNQIIRKFAHKTIA